MFSKKYTISMPMAGIVKASFLHDKEKFAYLDYEVAKGMKWQMRFCMDAELKDAFIEVQEQNFSFLGQSGYVFKDLKTGIVLGAWIPKKRFLNAWLRPTYTLYVDEKIVAQSRGENGLEIIVPSCIRGLYRLISPRKVSSSDGRIVARLSQCTVCGCGAVTMKPCGGTIENKSLATAIAVLAAICGLEGRE